MTVQKCNVHLKSCALAPSLLAWICTSFTRDSGLVSQNAQKRADNLISVDDLRANVYFRMHCTFANNVPTKLYLLRDGYSVNRNNGCHNKDEHLNSSLCLHYVKKIKIIINIFLTSC